MLSFDKDELYDVPGPSGPYQGYQLHDPKKRLLGSDAPARSLELEGWPRWAQTEYGTDDTCPAFGLSRFRLMTT